MKQEDFSQGTDINYTIRASKIMYHSIKWTDHEDSKTKKKKTKLRGL
jgi:hypothetical protein